MQISKSGLNTVNTVTSKFTKQVQQAVKNVAKSKEAKVAGVGAAAMAGMVIATKSSKERQERIEFLKELKLNDVTANKVLNAKDEDGQVVFNKRNLKALKETAELEDTAFFNHVMKNIDNVNYFNKTKDSKHDLTIYEMGAKLNDGTERMVQMIVAAGEIDTDLTDTNGKKTKTVMRTWTEDAVSEATKETELVKRKIGKKHPKTIQEEKVISDEVVTYNKANNKFTREVHDSDAFDYSSTIKTTKFSPQGVLDNTTVTTVDLEELKKIQSGKYKKADLEKMLGREIEPEEMQAIKTGDIPFELLEKMVTNKSVAKDFKNGAIINAKGGVDADMMSALTRTYKNPRTGRMETIKMELSDVKGVYNTTITDDKGNTRTECQATKDMFGNVKVEKNLESLDGTTTHYIYQASKDQNDVKMHYQIKDVKGNVLSTVDRTFNRVSPNLAYSSINGHSYVIEKNLKEKQYKVTDNLSGQETVIKFKDIFKNNESRKHPELLDKLSGDMLLDMYNRNYKYKYAEDALESYMTEDEMIIYTKNDAFVFSHEQGHTKDVISDYDRELEEMLAKGEGEEDIEQIETSEEDIEEQIETQEEVSMDNAQDFEGYTRISTHPEFRKAYEQERADFMRAFPDIEQQYVDYFIDRLAHYGGYLGGAMEVVAEGNALMSTDTGYDVLAARGYYLQKFFPKTIAVLAKLEMPHSNLYVENGQG